MSGLTARDDKDFHRFKCTATDVYGEMCKANLPTACNICLRCGAIVERTDQWSDMPFNPCFPGAMVAQTLDKGVYRMYNVGSASASSSGQQPVTSSIPVRNLALQFEVILNFVVNKMSEQLGGQTIKALSCYIVPVRLIDSVKGIYNMMFKHALKYRLLREDTAQELRFQGKFYPTAPEAPMTWATTECPYGPAIAGCKASMYSITLKPTAAETSKAFPGIKDCVFMPMSAEWFAEFIWDIVCAMVPSRDEHIDNCRAQIWFWGWFQFPKSSGGQSTTCF